MSTTNATPSAPAPTAAHHFNLTLLLQILAVIAPAITAPFAAPGVQAIVTNEASVASQVLAALAASQALKTQTASRSK